MAVKHVDVREAYRLAGAEAYTYVDVRSIPEYEQGHPAGAQNVPLLHYDAQTGQMTPNPEFLAVMEANYSHDARLLVGCQVGGDPSGGADTGLARVSARRECAGWLWWRPRSGER